MSQNNSSQTGQPTAHGLDLVREVLFGQEKRQTSEEFATLKSQITQLAERMARDLAQTDKTLTARADQFAAQTQAHFKQLETQMTENATRGADALASARAAIESQHQAHMKALADERAAFEARQTAFIAHIRNALDALTARPGAK